jgi:hypothetical protein
MARGSSPSGARLGARDLVVMAMGVVAALGTYLLISSRTYGLGFPLDDSWIHAVFARNLALHGEWAFQLGHPSAGSTSPLWTFLLVPGYWLHLEPLWWSYLLGASFLFALAVLMEVLARTLVAGYSPQVPWVGLFFVGEWHLQWAAVSGMETMLHALLLSLVVGLLLIGWRNHFVLGVLTGISAWVRPDGLTLVAPALLVFLLAPGTRRERSHAFGAYVLGVTAFLLPYLAVNTWLSGHLMPNTFYAKQAEYAAWQARPMMERLAVLAEQLIAGPALLLAPAVVLIAVRAVQQHSARLIAVLLWCVSYFVLYIVRLPAYQHGRYLIPAMPAFFLLGLIEYLELRQGVIAGTYRQVLAKAYAWGLGMLALGFFVLGARAYGQDVALIESEMVNTARWVAGNIPKSAVIAAHDIGALGYYDHHPLVDLAGLVSPEVLPFMRDQTRLAAFLDERNVQYLVAFPSLYPELARQSAPVFSSKGAFAPTLGGENMTVYCWHCP